MMRLRRFSVPLVLVLLVGACGPVTDDTTTAGPATGSPATEQSDADGGRTLTVGYDDDPYVQEGTNANVGMYPLNTNVFETLAYMTPDYEVEPMLAESWEFVEPNTWRFHLRQDVTFHDGQPLNAEAVKEGLFDRVAATGGGGIRAGEDSAEVVDEYTIDFTPMEENLRVPEQIVHPSNGVVSPGTNLAEEQIGTGPFEVEEYVPQERLVMGAYDDYWGDPASLERITFRFLPDAGARVLALEAGEIDFAFDVPREDVASLDEGGFEVVTSPVGAFRAVYANIHGEEPYDLLQDVRVRKAVSHAIDRQRLVEDVLAGLATTDQTMVPPQLLGEHADRVQGHAYDPATAVALLEEAGWEEGDDGIRVRDGRRLSLVLVSGFGGADVHRPVPAFLQSQLGAVGIELEVVERPDSASYQEVIDTGEGDLFLEQGSQNDANAGFLPVLLFYSAGGGGATAPYQSLFAPGEEFDELIAPVVTEVDRAQVTESVAAALEHLIDEQAVVLPLAGIYGIYVMDPAVEGFQPHPSALSTRWNTVTLE
jgi:peptide/nickel transport system substrate-binding protein